MNKYFFALGTNHTLSKIDIVNTLLHKEVDFEVIEASEEVLIVSVDGELDVQALIRELGSAAKIGIILKDNVKENLEENIEEILTRQNLLGKFSRGSPVKICSDKFSRVKEKFGISVYGAGGKFKELNEVFYSSREIARKIREIGRIGEIREIREQGRILSTVAVDKNGLLKNGFELVICAGSKGIYLGKTLAIQDYESYSFRDYSRPRKDAKSGMIPPKLAKMMINLAGKDKENLFLDPFCGSGTFLQELILLGYKNIIGSDVEEKAIEDTRKNLEWLKSNFPDVADVDKIKLIKSDARTLSSKIPYKSVDAIVSEPFLGSPKAKYLYPEQIKKEIAKIEDLYLSAFRELAKLLKDNGAVVIIFPIFRFKDQFFKLEILEKLKQIGFAQGKFIESKIKGEELLKLQITDRNSVVYFRPGQNVSREIFLFKFL